MRKATRAKRTSIPRRIKRFTGKYRWREVALRLKLYMPTMRDVLDNELRNLGDLEERVLAELEAKTVPQEMRPHYLAFSKRLLRIYKAFSGWRPVSSYTYEKQLLKEEFELRGLNPTILNQVQAVIEQLGEEKAQFYGWIVPPPQIVYEKVKINLTEDIGQSAFPYQLTSFYYNGYWYLFTGLYDPVDGIWRLYYLRSTNRVDWTLPNIGNPIEPDPIYVSDYNADWSVWLDPPYVGIVYAGRYEKDLSFRLGTITSDGIEWSPRRIVSAGETGVYKDFPSICRTPNKYWWITYRHYGVTERCYATKSADTEGTTWQDPILIEDVYAMFSQTIPVGTNQVMLFLNRYLTDELIARAFNGIELGPIEQVIPCYAQRFRALADPNFNIHVVTNDYQGNIQFTSKIAGEWKPLTIIDVYYCTPLLMIREDSTLDLYILLEAEPWSLMHAYYDLTQWTPLESIFEDPYSWPPFFCGTKNVYNQVWWGLHWAEYDPTLDVYFYAYFPKEV